MRTTSLSGQAAGPMGTPTSPVRTASLTKAESSPGRQPSFAKAESVTVTVSPPAVAVDLGKTTTSDEPTSDEPAKADPPAPSAEAEAAGAAAEDLVQAAVADEAAFGCVLDLAVE